MNLRSRSRSILALSLTVLFPCGVRAQDSAAEAQQAAYHGSMVQEGLARDATKLQAQLKTLLADLQTNGIKVDGMDDLTAAAAHLSDLNSQQMQQVIAQLQDASLASEDPKRQQALLGAYQGQKTLALQLKDMASQLSSEEAQNAIPLELLSLIKRQSANIRQTNAFIAAGGNIDQSVHSVVNTEQFSIGDEIALLMRRLAAGQSDFAKAANAVQTGPQLNDAAQQAGILTKNAQFDQAVIKQGAVKDFLVAMLAAVEAKKDVSQRLAEAQEQLDELRAEEKQVENATADKDTDSAKLKDKQAKVADQAAATSALLSQLNAPASDQIKQAQTAVEKSVADLNNSQTRDPAKSDEDTAMQALNKANDLLAKQIAENQSKEDESPDQQLADLEKLKSDVDQEKANAATAAPTDSASSIQQSQQDAATQAPEAASTLGAAAQAMQQSQTDRNQASALLGQASSQIQSKIDQAKADAAAYDALQKAANELAQAQQDATNAQSTLNANDAAQMNSAAQQLNSAQSLASAAQQSSPMTPAEALQAMKDAADALKNAGNSTVQGKTGDAKSQTGKGIQSLASAQASMAKALAMMAKSMNKNAGHGDKGGGTKFLSKMELNPTNHAKKAGDVGEVDGALSPVDRQAIVQYQAEKVVPGYASQIQEYMKNLADSSTSAQ